METNATRMCALLVGLPDVTVLAVDDQPGGPLRVHVEQRVGRPRCGECGVGGVGEGPPGGGVGGSAVLRAAGPAGVAQAPLALPRSGVSGGVVDRAGSRGRVGTAGDDENNTSDIGAEVNVLMHVRSAKAARRVAANMTEAEARKAAKGRGWTLEKQGKAFRLVD